jgi:hypothetical protein
MALVDRNGNTIRYGRINTSMVGGWARIDPANDGPFWALNLMKYRDIADYGDGADKTISGREADDAYTPRDSLAGIGAMIAFAADVESIPVGDGTKWDRIGIVRYPSRKAFLEMQQRDDFKAKHVHKDAGMEFTIVMSCLPVLPFGGSTDRAPRIELRLSAEAVAAEPTDGLYDVEGVIVGDERAWRQASFRWLAGEAESARAPVTDDRGNYVMILKPMIDRLTRSVIEGPVTV